jgi:hypothetical protein
VWFQGTCTMVPIGGQRLLVSSRGTRDLVVLSRHLVYDDEIPRRGSE